MLHFLVPNVWSAMVDPQTTFQSRLPKIHVRLSDLQTSAPVFSAPGLPLPSALGLFHSLQPKLNQIIECFALCLANSRCAITGDLQSPEQKWFQPNEAGSARGLRLQHQPQLRGVTDNREPPSSEPHCVQAPRWARGKSPTCLISPPGQALIPASPARAPSTEATPGGDVLLRV